MLSLALLLDDDLCSIARSSSTYTSGEKQIFSLPFKNSTGDTLFTAFLGMGYTYSILLPPTPRALFFGAYTEAKRDDWLTAMIYAQISTETVQLTSRRSCNTFRHNVIHKRVRHTQA